MPNRIIKESICVSETLSKLSWFEQCLFFRLIVSVDDFGRYFADSRVIRGKLFPLDNVTDKQVAIAVTQLATAGIIDLYEVGGRSYLQLETWAKHQRPPRAKESKFPANSGTSLTNAVICQQMPANAPVIRDSLFVNRDSGDSAHAREEKNKYGEFRNVQLSDDEYEKLNKRLGDIVRDEYIERLSGYLKQKRKSYDSHYAAILNWWRKDGEPVKRTFKDEPMKPDDVRIITADMTAKEIF